MENKKSKKGLVILLLLLAVVIMTIGFAAYTQNLTINGTVNVAAASWNVLYNQTAGVVESANSENATTATIDTNDTNFTFAVTLAEPGDFYEATIKAHNYGTLTAYLKSITMSTSCSDANYANYFSYSIKYNNGTAYTSSQTGLSEALAAGAEVPVVVRVEYLQPAANLLPTTSQTITVSGTLGYSSEA